MKRIRHSAFRMTSWEEVHRNIKTGVPRSDVLVNDISAAASGDSWSEVLVIYVSGDNFQFQLPEGTWHVAMERSEPVNQLPGVWSRKARPSRFFIADPCRVSFKGSAGSLSKMDLHAALPRS